MQTKSLDIARGMLKDKAPKEQVSMWTGLGLEEIERLVKELNRG